MNANVVTILLIPILLGGVMGASAGSPAETTTGADQTTAGEALGGEITVFMQQRTAATNGAVDSGMWRAGFERAESQSEKQTLVEQRAATLRGRLDRTEEQVQTFTPTAVNRSVHHRAKWARIAADVEALRAAISDAKTLAASEGVNASGLDRLASRAASLSVPNGGSGGQARVGDRPNGAAETLDVRPRRGNVRGAVAA
ncbi:hypothetical protein [Halococcus agarilyticus]|uniref:hypothetical protein n=1 Tax=Halococcus agarilyticus TaxID=1232219 RepID=UPI0006777A7C|nr:hypothetical protein [Halococcus agarilyticus]